MKHCFIKNLITGLIMLGPITVNASDYFFDNYSYNHYHDWYIYSDYLYLNACRSHLDHSVDYNNGTDTTLVALGEVKRVDDQWNSGFRVSFGTLAEKSIEFQARYTFFQTKKNFTEMFKYLGGATRLIRANLTSDNEVKLLTQFLDNVTPEYKLKYSVLDFDFGAWQLFDCQLGIRYYLGVRLAWINEDMNTLYVSTEAVDSIINVPESLKTDAYGVLIGFDIRYNFNNNFSIKTQSRIGALYGMADYHTINDYTTFTDPSVTQLLADVDGHDCSSIFSSEISAGLEYILCNTCGSYLILSIGYELHNWHGFTDFLNFAGNNFTKAMFARDEGSLLLHGLFTRFEVFF